MASRRFRPPPNGIEKPPKPAMSMPSTCWACSCQRETGFRRSGRPHRGSKGGAQRPYPLAVSARRHVLYGQGVPKDLAQGFVWYELAAHAGHAVAQYNLAVMLSKGQGCEPDLGKSIHFLRLAAEQGIPEAQLALANVYQTGQGLPRDEALARRWYEEAARKGNQTAAKILERITGQVPSIPEIT